MPLALAGFPPAMFLVTLTLNTLYQFFIHTRLVGRLGPLEWVINTPSHHRVHHGVNPRYVDRNYAGVFIIWDRLFGTFEPEGDEPVYGLVKPLGSFNPLWANLHRWVEIAAMSRRTRRLRDKLLRLARAARVAPRRSRRPGRRARARSRTARRSSRAPNRATRSARRRRLLARPRRRLVVHLRRRHARRTRRVVIAAGVVLSPAIVSFGWIYSPSRAR